MLRVFTALIAVALCVPAVRAADAPLAEGYWRLSQVVGVNESGLFVMKVEKKDGKLNASVVSGSSTQNWEVGNAKIDGSTVTLDVSIGDTKYKFEGVADAKDEKVIRGAMFDDARAFRMQFVKQDGEKIEPIPASARPRAPQQLIEVSKMNSAVLTLRGQIRKEKDINNKAELQEKLKAAQKEINDKSPALYREVLAKHAGSKFAVEAAGQLLTAAGRIKPKAEEVAEWVKIVDADSSKFGPRIRQDSALRIGEGLVVQKEVAALALPVAEKIAADLKGKEPLKTQSRVYRLLAAAQKAAGKTDAGTEAKFSKIESELDAEYAKTVPPFKPEKFAGRKDKSANRVVVMELFTGAQCPPCVAADVAFDALEKVYDPTDLVLIQYHMHIPGPDPLTNKDSIARYESYGERFPGQVQGTPSVLFNGKPFGEYDKDPMHRGGGAMSNARNKYDQYKSIIDTLLEEKSTIKMDGSVKLAGEKVSINLNIDGVASPSDKIKLRILLLEESIKYVGGNGLRVHHQVVRKVTEVSSVKEKSLKQTIAIDLSELKTNLNKYLDEFAAETPFPYTERPLDFKHLKAVALIQDDDSGEILNAVQLDVK